MGLHILWGFFAGLVTMAVLSVVSSFLWGGLFFLGGRSVALLVLFLGMAIISTEFLASSKPAAAISVWIAWPAFMELLRLLAP
jgi:hypothetical protein